MTTLVSFVRGASRVLFLFALGLGVGLVQSSAAQSSPVPEEAIVEKIADGFQFTEGPIWYQGTLLFSDIPANTVYQWTPGDSSRVFLKPSGHANGLAVSPEGRLLLAQHDGQVGQLGPESMVQPLAQSYQGKRLNSPNDLTVADDGTIYFTDPPYGVEDENRELDFSGVYRLNPDGSLSLLTKEFSRPNGIVLSPDESTLYVNDTDGNVIRAYNVTENGGVANGRVFATMQGDAPGNADGMKVDARGNLYTTGPGGIWVYAPSGDRLDRIPVPKAPTNVAFGGPERKTLYITAQSSVYRIPVTVPGQE
ncbi:MAG: SMP-30/gluconolactonase/LRE family protein [Salinibacter sp.]|uniref:SMP-30/gluconolactonase/LRE family protein n=1 Tax=Salinibacter sp. TaxID=2065818 RepID=UPI0035D4EAF1